MRKVVILVLVLLAFPVYAQYSPEFNLYKEKYKDANKVVLNREVTIHISIKNDGLDIFQDNIEETLYMTDGANMAAREDLNFSYFIELKDIEAFTTIFDGNRPKNYEVDNYIQKDNLDNSFYDDSKSVIFHYPNLKKGAKTYLKYSEKIKNPRFLGAFFLGDFFPIVNSKFNIIADKEIDLNFKEFNTEGLDIKFSKEEKWGNYHYTWKIIDVERFKIEDQSSNFRNVVPHILPIITSYKSKTADKKIHLSGKVDHLYQWYHSLVKDLNKEEPSEELKKLVEKLTLGKKNELEKVRAIYYWAQENIKYIAYEYALGGFVPREANLVFDRKYGDCKDNSSILKEMLEIAGIDGRLTWIGTRSIPYSYDDVPTPVVDNHMILSYRAQDGKLYFLDATGRFNPLEYPSSFIQGKEALIENGIDGYILEKVPVVPASQNVITDISDLEISGDDIKGKSSATITGYGKMDYTFYSEDLQTDSKIKDFYNHMFLKGSNKFLIDSITETNRDDYDKPLKVDYSFSISDYVKNFGEEIYLNLNLNKEITSFKITKERKADVEYEYTKTYDITNNLKIPAGYEVEYLPENIQISNDFFFANITYAYQDEQIVYRFKCVLDFILLTPEEQLQLNELLEDVEEAFKEVVILKQINS
ncbi:transglutaminase domain-containing protein [Gramella sp. KN1008]|uniref:DUF3857 domain-containing protein n=1 Tax=Gramella sp. KN1008 TaxID=2529298 RepID=UPI0010392986|nr:transglutaminase domain-containing protein [Gramella sp. KN1008]TBW26795.1 DUF3857 domain-containing protein [Gramella sp. KN1008]